jgi:hypothetical protein
MVCTRERVMMGVPGEMSRAAATSALAATYSTRMLLYVYNSEPPVQERDKVTGLPLWQFELMDADPEARRDVRTFRVKLASAVQPVLPEPIPGTPIRPVVLEGLTVSAWLEKDPLTRKPIAKIAYMVRATGVAAAKRDAGKAA